uniref:Uncharacterized protein n=1 Tax=Serinus canaria TaxID=9135 RepID=A0A8C9MM19_SERCA
MPSISHDLDTICSKAPKYCCAVPSASDPSFSLPHKTWHGKSRVSILQETIHSSQTHLFCTASSLAKCLEQKHFMLWLMPSLPDSPLPDLLDSHLH